VNIEIDVELRWRIFHSYDMDLKDVMAKWKNKLYELSTKRCA